MSKTVVMVPTYNESENISRLIEQLRSLKVPGQDIHVLVVDDNSPDGTGSLVLAAAAKDSHVELLNRTQNRGRGSAGIEGFKRALAAGADYIIEMDADFSHDPKYIPALLLAAEQGGDVVLGSRFVAGGADSDRGVHRKLITKVAGAYVRTVLGVRVRDVSSGYRCFRRRALEAIDLNTLVSTGPSIVLEILNRCVRRKLRLVEVPIIFIDRKVGSTKLNLRTLIRTLLMVLRFRLEG